MTVKITKAALNLREELADLRKPSGIAGEALLRADSVQEVRDQIGAGRKNLIINGGFDVWQRGTSTSLVGGPSYIGADRWKLYINTSSTVYMDRKDFTAGQTEVTGNPKHYLKFDWLGTGSSRVKIMEQLIEDVHTTQGKPVTLTFWARTQMADDPTISFTQKFGTGGSAAATAHSEVVNCTTSWQKFTITTTLPSISGKTVGIGSSLQISFAFSGTLNSYLEIAQVQLELGSVATDFEHRSYGEELALCQRYYYAVAFLNTGVYNTDTSVFCTVNAPSTFRVTPSVSMKSGTYTNINIEKNDTYDINSVSLGHGSTQEYYKYNPLVVLGMPARSGYAGQAGMVSCDRNDDAFVFDAEL